MTRRSTVYAACPSCRILLTPGGERCDKCEADDRPTRSDLGPTRRMFDSWDDQ